MAIFLSNWTIKSQYASQIADFLNLDTTRLAFWEKTDLGPTCNVLRIGFWLCLGKENLMIQDSSLIASHLSAA